MSNKLNAADYLLFLLDTDKRTPINGAIRLMKMMFLFNQEIMPVISKKGANVGELPQFFAYDFGPFSKDIYEQIEFFENLDFLKTSHVDAVAHTDEFDDWETIYGEDVLDCTLKDGYRRLNIDYKSIKYEITERGDKYVQTKIAPELSEDIKELLTNFKRKINSITTQQLLFYVYSRYEKFTTESKIKEKVLGKSTIMPDEAELVDLNDDNN